MKNSYERSIYWQKRYNTFDRNQRIKKVYQYNPDLTLREIGEAFGISRQRIFQITNNPYDSPPELPQATLSQKLRQAFKRLIVWIRRQQ